MTWCRELAQHAQSPEFCPSDSQGSLHSKKLSKSSFSRRKKKLDAESAGYLSAMVHLQGYQDAWDSPGRHTFGCVCEGVSRKEAEVRRLALNMGGTTTESWGFGLNGNEKVS